MQDLDYRRIVTSLKLLHAENSKRVAKKCKKNIHSPDTAKKLLVHIFQNNSAEYPDMIQSDNWDLQITGKN